MGSSRDAKVHPYDVDNKCCSDHGMQCTLELAKLRSKIGCKNWVRGWAAENGEK